MGAPIDMTGSRYGRLTVVELTGDRGNQKQRKWKCVCDCGNEVIVAGSQMRSGMTKSCGCLHKEVTSAASKTHGMSKAPIWSIHRAMMDRCYLPTSHAYGRYGGRGIIVCERWHDFESFYIDMGDRPDGMSLERQRNAEGYSPDNVIWATAKEQANNRRSNVFYEYGDERMTLAQWADKGMVGIGTLWSRLQRGVPFPICLLNIDLKTLRGRFNHAA